MDAPLDTPPHTPGPTRRTSRAPGRSAPILVVGAVVFVLAAFGLGSVADGRAVVDTLGRMVRDPTGLGVGLLAFATAFALRALVWTRVLPGLGFGHAWAGIHVSLGGNHVLPLRLGEPLRVVSVVRRSGVSLPAAAASTVALRLADLLALGLLAVAVAPQVIADVTGWWGLGALVLVVAASVPSWRWVHRLTRTSVAAQIRMPAVPEAVVGLGVVATAWVLEAVLVWEAAGWAGLELSFADAIVVGTVAVAAQTVAITPGGIGTYEAAAVVAYVALGHDAADGLAAAVATHAAKTAYAVVAGAVACAWPAPSIIGRLRLDRRRPSPPDGPVSPEAPVLLFLPAHDEEATVARCVRAAPASVGGRRVHVVVVDDGSTDGTAAAARRAGATVLSLGANRGLGAAVRVGLAHASTVGAAAVAFCDADMEYAPDELGRLVEPILAGTADYVVGTRFGGTIEHMRPHRRLGNRVLTAALRVVARAPITDGQSGYRALSAAAAADAEIVHDYNYAQVLTLDLLDKGYRYAEVPITYRFRTTGTSFVRLGRYLRRVVPAVYRELNPAASFFEGKSITRMVPASKKGGGGGSMLRRLFETNTGG